MGQVFFAARDLWSTQVPYAEPDKVEPLVVTAIRTMVFATCLKGESGLACDASVAHS